MSYVSIWKPVYDRIVKASRDSLHEIIGLLIGSLENDAIVINDSVTGDFFGEPHRVTLNPITTAKIADDILKGRLKGNIVGWYHSHTEGGVFFSRTDADTQKRFQQFSRLIVGMVVHAESGNVGFFRVDSSGNTLRIPQDRLRVYEEADTVPAKPPQLLSQPVMIKSQPSTKRIVGLLLIALILSVTLLGGILYRYSSPTFPRIVHDNPVLNAIVGSSILISASATGVSSMMLFYALDGGSFNQVSMTSKKSGEFRYVIPGSQAVGNITYYMEGVGESGLRITTKPYQIRVSDFMLQLGEALTVYRNSTKPAITKLSLVSINGFTNGIALSANGMPSGITVSFSSSQATPGAVLNMSVLAEANTPVRTFPLFVFGSYSSSSQIITRMSKILVTVTDFEIEVTPVTLSAGPDNQVSFSLNVTFEQGFAAPLKLAFIGLPEGARTQLISSTNTISLIGLSNMALNIQVAGVKQGTYPIIIVATATLENGDFISHTQLIQLTVG